MPRFALPMLCAALLLLGAVPGLASRVAAQDELPVTPTPLASERPDRCERNDSVAQACVLPLDTVSGPFTFLPDGDQDYFSVDMGEQPGLALEIAVRGTGGLDLRTTVSRPDGAALATIVSPTISSTLSPDLAGWVVLRVENRSPEVAGGESYSIELRQTLPPAPPVDPQAVNPALQADRLENNWSAETASPVGVGYVYDLNFVCPVAWGCVGGDHDYLQVPVKAGVAYLFATFDLGPGVDTVLDLFWGDTQAPLTTNDDAHPGAAFLSVLRWRAPADGIAVVRVGPRTGGLTPTVFDEKASSYRFAVVLADSDLARQLERRIAEQAALPTATPAPARPAASEPASSASGPVAPAPAAATPATDAPKGLGATTEQTSLRAEPEPAAPVIQELAQGAQVELLGQAVGPWVRVQPLDGVVPGWVYGPDLRRADAATTTAPPTTTTTVVAHTPETAAQPRAPQVRALEPVPAPPAAPAVPNQRLELEVELVQGPAQARSPQGLPTALPKDQRPLRQVRVQLVTVFGDVLAEALTGVDGRVGLSRDLAPSVVAFVRVPALGVQAPVSAAQPLMQIIVPEEATQ